MVTVNDKGRDMLALLTRSGFQQAAQEGIAILRKHGEVAAGAVRRTSTAYEDLFYIVGNNKPCGNHKHVTVVE